MQPFVKQVIGSLITDTKRFRGISGVQRPEPAMIVTSVNPADGLQPIVDSFGGNGGRIELDTATYYANPASPLTPLSIVNPNIEIVGIPTATMIGSPILAAADWITLRGFTSRPIGAAYGIKFYQSGGRVARCALQDVLIGAVDANGRINGQGPGIGLYLDGSILLEADRCTFAFNVQSGVYMQTTLSQWSTNVNKFRGCSSIQNGRYGVEMIGGGQDGNEWNGGNIESSLLGGVYATGVNQLTFRGVDFENTTTVNALIEIDNTSPALVEDCNFVATGGGTQRAVLMQGVGGGRVKGCRGSGTTAKDWIVFTDTCVACDADSSNLHTDSRMYVNNRGRR